MPPAAAKTNPPPVGTRYFPSTAIDPDDANASMTWLNAVRTAVEVLEGRPDATRVEIMVGGRTPGTRDEPDALVAIVRRHREWPGRIVVEIDLPDDVPDTAWQLAHRSGRIYTNIVAVVRTGRAAPGELTVEETRARIRQRILELGGDPEVQEGWAVFDTETDRGFEIQIDEEFWSGARDDERISDDDAIALPEAQEQLADERAQAARDAGFQTFGPVHGLTLSGLGTEDAEAYRVVLLDAESGVGQDGDMSDTLADAVGKAIGMSDYHTAPVIVWGYFGPDLEQRTVFSVAPQDTTLWMYEYADGDDDLAARRASQDVMRRQAEGGRATVVAPTGSIAQRIARGEDMADVIDQQLELRRQARAAVATALNIDIDTRGPDPFLDAIVGRLNFTISFRQPAYGELAWEVARGADFDDARDEIWRESDDLGWVATAANTEEVSAGMKYAVIQADSPGAPGAGDLSYVINKFIADPEKFTEFAEAAARRLSTSDPTPGPTGARVWRFGPTMYSAYGGAPPVEQRTQGWQPPEDERVARAAIQEALHLNLTNASAEIRELARHMVRDVARRMVYSSEWEPDWTAIRRMRDDAATPRDFERQVHFWLGESGWRFVDANGEPYSLQRPPAFAQRREEGPSTTQRIPVRYTPREELEELEVAIGIALNLRLPTGQSDARRFVAAVWEELLRMRASGAIPFVYSRSQDLGQFNAQITRAAHVIARQYGNYWEWAGLRLPTTDAPVAATGVPSAEQVPPEARGIVEAMATPRREEEWFQGQAAIGAAILSSDEDLIRRIWLRMIAYSTPEQWAEQWRTDRVRFNRAVQGVQASLAEEDARARRTASGSEAVPGMRGRMAMVSTAGGRGSYPSAIREHVRHFRDSSYGNDTYDSVEFSIGDYAYRLWIAQTDPAEREIGDDLRYTIDTIDPPFEGASLQQTFEDGQPSGDQIFATEDPEELFRFIRDRGAPDVPTRLGATRRSARDTTGIAEPYIEGYLAAIAAMDHADDIGGPGDNEYILVMNGIAAHAQSRAYHPRRAMTPTSADPEETEEDRETVLSSPVYEDAVRAMTRIWNTALGRNEEETGSYVDVMQRIATEAVSRADVVARVLGGEREADVRREMGIPLRPAPISPSQWPRPAPTPPRLDMSDVRGLNEVVAVAEQAVAGHQNLLLIGPPGVGKTMIARRIPTIMPDLTLGQRDRLTEIYTAIRMPEAVTGEPPMRAPHHTITQAGLVGTPGRPGELQLATYGVLFLDEYHEFQPAAIEALARELLRMPKDERPLIVASVESAALPRRLLNLIDFPLRAEVRALQMADMRYGPQAEPSAVIRARIHATPKEPEDLTAARFAQLELGRPGPPSPMERSIRLARQLQVGTRVQVVKAIIRPPDLYIPRGTAGEVTTKDDRSGEQAPNNWRIEVTMDDGTKVWWANMNLEHLGEELEIEPEAVQRYRMIELNPSKRRLKHNPAWVTKLLSKHYEFLEDKVQAKWLPRLTDVDAKHGKITAAMREYGCGAYGCVLPTLDPKVVLKVTTDDTEAQFAERLAGGLTAQVTVTYHLVARLPEKRAGREVWLLWRDSATDVGGIDKLAKGKDKDAVDDAIIAQHKAAQIAFVSLINLEDPDGAKDMAKRMVQSKRFTAKEMKRALSTDPEDVRDRLDDWEAAAVAMGRQIPELADLADGMVTNLRQDGVFMGDVHADNIGLVSGRWLIVDPGHVSVLTSK